MNWYYVDAGQQAGPVTDDQLDELVRTGKVRGDTLIWREGMGSWEPYTKARPGGIAAAVPPTAPPLVTAGPTAPGGEVVCAECQQLFPRESTVQYGNVFVCAACKPRFVARLREGGALPGGETEFAYAGFWIRFVAKFIDGLILGVLLGIPIIFWLMASGVSKSGGIQSTAMSLGVQGMIQFGYFAVSVLYNTFFIGKFGATPGKMALGLKVVAPDGSPASWGQATGRAFSEILSGLICNIGYIIAAFDTQKRALHDHMAGTRVVHTR